ncbi:MAG: branched-chain amino acid ABC transporter permease [Flavobacteriaceae bacterium]
MIDFMPVMISGIASGSAYALLALGLVVIFRSTHTVNFAIGDLGTLGVYVAASALAYNVPFFLVFLLAVGVSGSIGVASERLLVRPLGTRKNFVFLALVVTIGLSLFIQALVGAVWGHQMVSFPPLVPGNTEVAGVTISWNKIFATGLAVVAMIFIGWFFAFTPFGTAMRATAEDPFAGRIIGLDGNRIRMVAWFLGCGLSAIGMLILAAETALTPTLAHQGLFRAFAAVFLGGLTSMPGAAVAGFVIGVLENIAGRYVSAAFRDTIVFGLIVAVLFIRPSGILGRRSTERV